MHEEKLQTAFPADTWFLKKWYDILSKKSIDMILGKYFRVTVS